MYQIQKAPRKELGPPSVSGRMEQTQKGQDWGVIYVQRNEGRHLKMMVIGHRNLV